MGKNGFASKILPVDQPLPIAQRLIVFVPDIELDEIAFGRFVWNLALTHRSEVLYLAVVQNDDGELRAIQRLTALAAVTRDPRLKLSTLIRRSPRWESPVRDLLRPGDILICLGDHLVRAGLLRKQLLSQVLANRFAAQICVLPAPHNTHLARHVRTLD